MEIAGKEILTKAYRKHPSAKVSILRWIDIVESKQWANLVDIKQNFPAVDYIPPNTFCFDIGGNNYRLLTAIAFGLGIVKVKDFLTHAEYDKRKLGR